MERTAPARLVLVLLLLAGRAAASDSAPVSDDHVREALEAAGTNRSELERFLARHSQGPDAEFRDASRFLVANMPGKGYVRFELRDAKGEAVSFDPLSFETFSAAQEALDRIEKERGTTDFARAGFVSDVETVRAAALARHLERSIALWRATPPERRVGFAAFLEHLLPYRGSEEPVDDWLGPLSERHAATAARTKDARALYEVVTREAGARVRFDERYYLHPTDQGFSEMETSRMGRCEDITNMTTYLARSVGLATAADFTPAWGHRDNNHAWNVLLDAQGRGSDPVGARAAKVYRKTFSIQRDGLVDRLPKGREAPNRWLASRALVDVTDQYGPTTDVELFVDARRGEERIGYLCVFNGGDWTAIAWSSVEWGPPSRPLAEPIASSKGATRVRFSAMGRRLLYLPAVHDGTSLRAVGSPFVVHMDGSIATLDGDEGSQTCLATATSPEQQSPDTKEVTPTSNLVPGTTYVLHRFLDGRWAVVEERVAPREPLRFEKMSPSSLYWLVAKDSRRLERPFTVEGGRQRFW